MSELPARSRKSRSGQHWPPRCHNDAARCTTRHAVCRTARFARPLRSTGRPDWGGQPQRGGTLPKNGIRLVRASRASWGDSRAGTGGTRRVAERHCAAVRRAAEPDRTNRRRRARTAPPGHGACRSSPSIRSRTACAPPRYRPASWLARMRRSGEPPRRGPNRRHVHGPARNRTAADRLRIEDRETTAANGSRPPNPGRTSPDSLAVPKSR